MMKGNRLVASALYAAGALTAAGTIAGAVNSLLDLAQRDEFTDEGSWLLRTYVQVTGWLSISVTLPVWLLLPALALAAWIARLAFRQRSTLIQLTQELDKLKNPTVVDLDATDERVLFWIKKIYDSTSTGLGPTPADVAKAAEMPLSNVEAAVDVLKRVRLIRLKKFKSDPLDLTAEGRAYFNAQGVQERFDSFEMRLLSTRI